MSSPFGFQFVIHTMVDILYEEDWILDWQNP